MGQYAKMHLVLFSASLVTIGLILLPSSSVSIKVRLISPTPYLFPELSISGRKFNFLPPFTTHAELSTKSKKTKESPILKQTHSQDIPRFIKIKPTVIDEKSENEDSRKTKIKNEHTLASEETNIPKRINVKSDSTKPIKTKTHLTNDDINTWGEDIEKHNRHFIGSHIGGVGGVFPPVEKASSKKSRHNAPLQRSEDGKFVVKNSYLINPSNGDSTCLHDNEVYKAGELIKLSHKSNPCDKCRCEKREGGGIVNCFWQQCEGLPALGCIPLFIPGACCPIYTCDGDDLGI